MPEEFKKDMTRFLKDVAVIDFVVFVVLCLAGQFSLPLVLGFVLGYILVGLDFYLIIKHTVQSIYHKSPKRKAALGYYSRFGTITLILGLCFYQPFINQWVVCLHLFYPKLIFYIKAILRKRV